jgi:hypothetical protein
VALTLYKGGAYGIGVYDLERRLLTPVALAGDNYVPTWTKDGDRITFMSNAGGGYRLYSIPFDGSGKPEPLFSADQGLRSPEMESRRHGDLLSLREGVDEGSGRKRSQWDPLTFSRSAVTGPGHDWSGELRHIS